MESGSRRNMVLLGYIAKKARELQVDLPDIVDDWVDGGFSQKDIVKNRGLVDFLGIRGRDPDNTATSVVRAALYGFDEIGNIEGFPGLVSEDVYVKVARRHRKTAVDNYNENGQTSFVNMDKEALGDISKKGVEARGRISIEDGEMEFAYRCSLNPDYVVSRGVGWVKVSVEVNERFGNNRTKKAVRGMVYKFRENLS